MGTYCTTTTLDTRMIGVAFDTPTTALASEMITDAEAEVNKYLSRRYDISGSTFQVAANLPPTVRMLTTRLAEAYMWKSMSRGSKESITRGNALEKSVMDNLIAISEYKVDLVDTAGGLIVDMSNTSYRVLCNTTQYVDTFDEGDPNDWAVDPNKRDDISNGKQ